MKGNLLAFVIGVGLDVGVIYAAAAADLPLKAPVYAAPVLYNWSGLYLGANIGGAWSNDDPSSTTFIGGFQLGYNLQAGHFLVGVEGDFDWASFDHPDFTALSPLGPVQFSDSQKWISTVAARFGFVYGRLLAYGKVGGGWAHDNATLNFPNGTNWASSNTNGGWLFGVGLEYGLKPNWTVKVEYDYLNLGDWTSSTVPAVSWRRDTQMYKLGMNYKFESGASDDATRTPDDQAGSSRAKGQDIEELAKASPSQNPVASLIAATFRDETIPDVGPFNRTENVLSIRPVVPISVNAQWNIISRSLIPLTSQPNPLIDSNTNGVGDITEELLLSPVDSGVKDFYWGFGSVTTAPSASDPILGTGKILLGPELALFWRPEHWVIGAISNNQWSVGGAPGRPPVNFFTSEYFISYNIPGGQGWYLTSSPTVTVNWTAAPGKQLTFPVGGGFGRVFKVGDQSIDASIQGFYHVIHPEGGPTWSLRAQVSFLFPDR